ncbi:T6D22.10 [Arabidopsis thaliana]|nr:T6D22.10 [Arabidopsis thaliana]
MSRQKSFRWNPGSMFLDNLVSFMGAPGQAAETGVRHWSNRTRTRKEIIGSFAELDFGHCETLVKKWADSSSSREEHVNKDKRSLKDLLFFLHVPRTGGRTYFHCFLRKLYDSSEECPRSYDKLHFNPRKEKCKLLATHDDYSLMAKLPRERTSVMTIVRDPIARVLSTYEFSVEVAARFLVHPNLTSASRMSSRIRKSNVISTLDIWPWKYLVPWMREDLFARRDARKLKEVVIIEDDNPYDMEEMLMPLHKYLDAPTAHDIIHNGATFQRSPEHFHFTSQIAGLTNNSHLSEAHEVRHCVQKFKSLGESVLQVAKRRLDSMLYVGLTEEHRESASLFANVVGSQVLSQVVPSNATAKIKALKSVRITNGCTCTHQIVNFISLMLQKQVSQFQKPGQIRNGTSEVTLNKAEAKSGNVSRIPFPIYYQRLRPCVTFIYTLQMTVKTLMEVYEGCITHLRKSQGTRRVNSLKRITPANFTRGTRTRVPKEVIQQIKSLNNLDVELYKYAKVIFAKEHELVSNKLISSSKRSIVDLPSELKSVLGEMGEEKLWKFVPVALMLLLIVLFFLFVNAKRRRTSKIVSERDETYHVGDGSKELGKGPTFP